jgi:hypothetical protein
VSIDLCIQLGLGLAVAGFAFYGKIKAAQAQTHADVSSTIITAIEGLEPAASAAVKAAVTAKGAQMGTGAAVAAVVAAVTKNL